MLNRSLFLIRPSIRNLGQDVETTSCNQKHIKPHQFAIIFLSLVLNLLSPLNARSQDDSQINPLERAASLIRANRINEAEQQLISILKAAPNEPQALNLLGTLRASQSRFTEAETLFARAIRVDPRMVGAHLNLAYLYLLRGAPDKTVAELKEVLSIDPNDNEALHKLARLLLLQGRPDECIDLIEKSTQPTLPVTLLVMRGEAYLKKGDADKAEASFRAALEKQSSAPDALLGLAQVSQSRGDAKASADYLYRVRQMSADSPDLLYKLGVAALKSGAYDEAKSSLEQAIRIKPDEAAYHIALGATRLKKPDLFEAERDFRRALQLQPDSSQGQMYLGYSLLKQKKYAEARTYLEKSIKTDRSIPEPFYYLSLIAQGQNEEKRAVEILEDVIKRFPDFVNA